jgi:hypothetical protein
MHPEDAMCFVATVFSGVLQRIFGPLINQGAVLNIARKKCLKFFNDKHGYWVQRKALTIISEAETIALDFQDGIYKAVTPIECVDEILDRTVKAMRKELDEYEVLEHNKGCSHHYYPLPRLPQQTRRAANPDNQL